MQADIVISVAILAGFVWLAALDNGKHPNNPLAALWYQWRRLSQKTVQKPKKRRKR